jgi:hypothetical protein
MFYQLLADLVLLAHFAFVAFAVLGGMLVIRYPTLLWPHLLALCWGIVVQWANWTCPLTPLENHLRRLSGSPGYSGSFIEYFVSQVLYPDRLTLELRYALGLMLLLVNLAVYAYVLWHRQRAG